MSLILFCSSNKIERRSIFYETVRIIIAQSFFWIQNWFFVVVFGRFSSKFRYIFTVFDLDETKISTSTENQYEFAAETDTETENFWSIVKLSKF